ncbi:ricin-type beta-trefoil lectin domain protein [Streptomyces cinereospinus]|uniref:Ricin-type beta-trefoil lectin domain protein n=1 Tax=Streptomyces cinereospinus TaxID=285561 RepID=A0ABV5N6U4_9ACTN
MSLFVTSQAPAAHAAAFVPKTPPLTTPWTDQVPVDHPLPEYPRPQLTRPDWRSLNGVWDFRQTAAGAGPPGDYSEAIRVPYPVESALSGIMRHPTANDRIWYRRTFTVPADWAGRRVQLNFGAVDFSTTVWVNGTQVGTHTGGYDAFGFDITSALVTGGTNTVVVGVHDATDAPQPRGKQTHDPGGIKYTATSGIWQTVWLEPTPTARITRLDMTPDLPSGTLRIIPRAVNAAGRSARVTVSAGGTVVGTATGAVGSTIAVPVPNARLWSPDDPFLYDVRVDLLDGGGAVADTVGSYAGMRSVSIGMVNGTMRTLLNGRPVFMNGVLDQGYWPDGNMTAPTDEALRWDLQAEKAMGFNTVRKHVKVEPMRWYYWADRLGLLVWQDMPSGDADGTGRQVHEAGLRSMIDQLRSAPSVVMWVVFNEGWGQYDSAGQADLVKSLDPSRLVNNNSGGNGQCCGTDGGNGDVSDNHIYPGPGDTLPPSATRAAVLGEYGGIGKRIKDHTWQPVAASDTNDVTTEYERIAALVKQRKDDYGLSGAIYTQPTDVEMELNGLYTYDRRVAKVDIARMKAANDKLVTGVGAFPPIGATITGPGGKCVDVAADDTGGNGSKVQLWDCQSSARDQHYTAAGGALRTLGRCLDITGANPALGTPVQLWDCNGTWGQRWVPQPDGSLRNPQSGRCLDSPNGSTDNGAALRIWDCNGTAAQNYQFNGGWTVIGPGGKCVDVAADDTGGNGSKVQLWDCQDSAEDQHYTAVRGTLRTLGRCLDITGANPALGTPVQLWDCNGTWGQQWLQQDDGSLRNPQSGRCLDSPNGSTDNGAALRIWDCNGTAAQKFVLT